MTSDVAPIGSNTSRPFRVAAAITTNSFGDFISSLQFIQSVAEQFENHEVTFIYRADCDFKTPLVSILNPKYVVAWPAGRPLPSLELFSASGSDFAPEQLKKWFEGTLQIQDFVLFDAMVRPDMLCSFDPPARLSFEGAQSEAFATMLERLGISRHNWFCCIHCREPGYKYKSNKKNFRDADPLGFLSLRDHVIDDLGGQVVRLGHPGMTPFPNRPGYVDLSRIDGSILEQAFAASRARFMVTTPSGAQSLGQAFGVPTGTINCVDFWQVNRQDLLSTVEVTLKDGSTLKQQALFESGLDKLGMIQGLKNGSIKAVEQNSAPTIKSVATALFRETSEIESWRSPTPNLGSRPNRFEWPRRAISKMRFL